MNRPIKFRAWDGERMKVVTAIGWIDTEVDYISTPKASAPADNFVLMQFTGLLDKNGKEIYEGDILRINNNLIEEVKWVDEDNWHGDCVVTGFVNHKAIYHKGPEIIGNIYEHPELLNV